TGVNQWRELVEPRKEAYDSTGLRAKHSLITPLMRCASSAKLALHCGALRTTKRKRQNGEPPGSPFCMAKDFRIAKTGSLREREIAATAFACAALRYDAVLCGVCSCCACDGAASGANWKRWIRSLERPWFPAIPGPQPQEALRLVIRRSKSFSLAFSPTEI